MRKNVLSGLLALSMMLAPSLAMADGMVKLQPLQTGYGSSTPAYNSYSNGSTGTYGTGYNNYPSSNNPYLDNNYYNVYGPSDSTIMLRGQVTQIPKGTLMQVRLDQAVSSESAHIGQPVSATLESDIFVNDSVAIPAGSQVMGQVADAKDAKHMGLHGMMDIRFSSVKMPDGRTVPFSGHVVTSDNTGVLKGDTYTKDIAKGVGIAAAGTGIGTLMGTAAGSLIGSAGAGAVFGLGVGALGGMGYALARKGREVELPADARLSVVVDQVTTTTGQ